jgi:hypothetical protein
VDDGTGLVTLREVPTGAIGCVATRTTNQSDIGTSAVRVAFNSSRYDSDNGLDTTTNVGRYTVPAGAGGLWAFYGTLYFDEVGAATNITVDIRINGADDANTLWRGREIADDEAFTISDTRVVDGGDYIEIWVTITGTTGADIRYLGTNIAMLKVGSGTVGEAIGAQAGRNSAVQSVGASYTKLTLDTEEWDTDGYFDDANDRMTIPTGLGGPHRITGTTHVASGTSGTQYLVIYKNGAAWRRESSLATGGVWAFNFSVVDPDAVAGDYYELWAYASGGARNWGSSGYDPQETRLTIEKIATSGAQPGRVRTGTSFPTPGAAWTDRFVRTDLNGVEFTHDGTRWVSTTEYALQFDRYAVAINVTSWMGIAPVPADLKIYITKWHSLLYASTAADWTISLETVAYDGTYTALDSDAISITAANTWKNVTSTVGTVVDGTAGHSSTNIVGLRIMATKDTAAANVNPASTVYYRLIAT